MKLLLSHRFFWPDSAPYGLILRDIAFRLASRGHEVHVQSAVPSYAARLPMPSVGTEHGVSVYRCPSLKERGAPAFVRAFNSAIYLLVLLFRILKLRPDVVTASTFPPVVAAWAAGIASKLVGARFVYHVQDIHPEASAVIGARLGRGVVASLLRRMDTATLRRADVVVTLTEDMAATLRDRGAPIRDLRLIENPALDDPDSDATVDPSMRKTPGAIRAIFAGNLGRFQNLPVLADGVAALFPEYPQLELCFLGDGAALATLRSAWEGTPQVRFLPPVPVAVARQLLAEADVGLVALQPGMHRVASPSKVQTYAALGLPIVALVDPDSHLAAMIEGRNLGRVARHPTAQGVASALRDVLAQGPRRGVPEKSATEDTLAAWPDLIGSLERKK